MRRKVTYLKQCDKQNGNIHSRFFTRDIRRAAFNAATLEPTLKRNYDCNLYSKQAHSKHCLLNPDCYDLNFSCPIFSVNNSLYSITYRQANACHMSALI